MNVTPLTLLNQKNETALEQKNAPAEQLAEIERRLVSDKKAVDRRTQRLGDTLQAMGLLSDRHINQITRIQARTGEPFGKIAMKSGFVKPDDIQAAIGVQFGFLRESNNAIHIPERLVVMRKPHSKQSEQIRLMRTRLVTSCSPEDLQVMSVIGVGNDGDAVEMAANLGATFAQLHRRVLVIDANLRNPGLGKFFKPYQKNREGPGLSDYLCNRARFDDVIQESLVARMDMIVEGQRAYNPQILLGGGEFDALLERAKQEYDVIINLSSGFGLIADGHFVWDKSDSALIVARKNKTREDELKKLAAVLYDLNTKILGAVLAK